jgi:hypothetical protein
LFPSCKWPNRAWPARSSSRPCRSVLQSAGAPAPSGSSDRFSSS